MSDRELEIFILCEKLAELLGNGEAIADLRKLYNHHPEMFKDMQEVSKVINEVVQEPEIMMNAKREGAIFVAKRLKENKKMGEVALENDNGTNVIFHANKKREREFYKISYPLVETPTPSTHRSKSAGELMIDNQSSGTNVRSMDNSTIVPQSPNNDEETYMIPNQNTSNTHFITQDSISNLSLEEQISLAKENQKTLNAMPKASDIDKDINKDNTQENTQAQDTTQRVETQSQKSTLRRK